MNYSYQKNTVSEVFETIVVSLGATVRVLSMLDEKDLATRALLEQHRDQCQAVANTMRGLVASIEDAGRRDSLEKRLASALKGDA